MDKINHGATAEIRILDAARKVFIARGFDGTSMQQIAAEAGINKSLLHYYYRSKEKLFASVFQEAFSHFVPRLQDILISDLDFFEKISQIVRQYIDLLQQNEFVPAFVLHEIHVNPDRLFQTMIGVGVNPALFAKFFEAEIRKGSIRPIDPRHLIVNLISMCVFPFAAKPLLQRLFLGNSEEDFKRFIEDRKTGVAEFIIQSLKPDTGK